MCALTLELRRHRRQGGVGRETDDDMHGIAAHTGLPVGVALERPVRRHLQRCAHMSTWN